MFYSSSLPQFASFLLGPKLAKNGRITYFFAKSLFHCTECRFLFHPILLLCFSTFFTSRRMGITIPMTFFHKEIIKFSPVTKMLIIETSNNKEYVPYRKGKGAFTLCRAAECNTLQLCRVAKVARHIPPMRSRPAWKRIFCRPSSGYQNCGTRSANLVRFFFSNWLIPFWNPLFIICCAASFDGTDNLPIKFLGRTASNGMPQPSRRNVHIYLWHGATFAAWPCRTLPLCAARHSVNVT